MMTETNTITMFIRDDRTLEVSVFTDKNEPVDLTNAKIYFTAKSRISDPDSAAIITKRNAAAGGSDEQLAVIDAPRGLLEVYLRPADTANASAGSYVYDIQIVLANGKTYTAVRDKLILKDDVTKNT